MFKKITSVFCVFLLFLSLGASLHRHEDGALHKDCDRCCFIQTSQTISTANVTSYFVSSSFHSIVIHFYVKPNPVFDFQYSKRAPPLFVSA